MSIHGKCVMMRMIIVMVMTNFNVIMIFLDIPLTVHWIRIKLANGHEGKFSVQGAQGGKEARVG